MPPWFASTGPSSLEPVVFVLVCLGLCLLGNARTDLWDRDEPRYAETARVMLATGDYIVPYFNDEFRFQKPILTYWLVALSYALFGVSAFSARLVSVVAVTATCLVVRRVGNAMFGAPAGTLAGWALALCPMVLLLGKLCLPDGIHLFLATVSLASLYFCHRSRGNEPVQGGALAAGNGVVSETRFWGMRPAFLFWISMGLAVLTKGPIVPGLLIGAAVVYRLLGGSLTSYRLDVPMGLAVLAIVVAPWMLTIRLVAGSAFYAESVGHQLAGRLTQSFDGKFWPPGYYLATIVVGFLPWIALLGKVIRDHLATRWREPALRFTVAWAVGPLIVLELFRSKQPHYAGPIYPALALWLGAALAPLVRRESKWRWDGHVRWCLRWTALAAVGVPLGATLWAWNRGEPFTLGLASATLILAAAVILSRVQLERQQWRSAAAVYAVGWVGAWILIFGLVAPQFAADRLMRTVAERLRREHEARGLPMILHQLVEPSLVFYSGQAIPIYFDPATFRRVVERATSDYLAAMTIGEISQLPASLQARLEILETFRGRVKMSTGIVQVVRIRAWRDELADGGAEVPR